MSVKDWLLLNEGGRKTHHVRNSSKYRVDYGGALRGATCGPSRSAPEPEILGMQNFWGVEEGGSGPLKRTLRGRGALV